MTPCCITREEKRTVLTQQTISTTILTYMKVEGKETVHSTDMEKCRERNNNEDEEGERGTLK